MYAELKGKIALITGAGLSTGIGFGIAEQLAANGMDILLADLPGLGGRMDESCALLRKYGVRVEPLELDIADETSIRAAVEAVRTFTPSLRALVNNAGINRGASRIGDYDAGLWKSVLDINLMGPFLLTRALLPLMERGGSVVNVASRAGKRPLPTCSAYSVSKAGLIMFTKCLAVEYAADGIRANALCPGQILTEMNLRRYAREAVAAGCTPEESMRKAIDTVPIGRIGTPRDVGLAAAFLVSDASGYMTGQALNVTGGQITEL
ncbi:SDR family NAD(P)-dependent oxidoreductase [uncultured Bilophila sp.]|uniref:SDR family NAD(P)-dependent oxidoreductase n=1 Tax=uncultured Bilophila sp. TaxID=529385 RepID=UPI0026DBC0FC|nr:SDR family oxidoreductase [uncultured Bilophila sp.]